MQHPPAEPTYARGGVELQQAADEVGGRRGQALWQSVLALDDLLKGEVLCGTQQSGSRSLGTGAARAQQM